MPRPVDFERDLGRPERRPGINIDIADHQADDVAVEERIIADAYPTLVKTLDVIHDGHRTAVSWSRCDNDTCRLMVALMNDVTTRLERARQL